MFPEKISPERSIQSMVQNGVTSQAPVQQTLMGLVEVTIEQIKMAEVQISDSDSDLESTTPVKPRPKRRRIIDSSSITTVPIYSNKVNSSLQLNPTIPACDVDEGDDAEEVRLWARSPSLKKDHIDSSDSEEKAKTEDEDMLDLRSPSPPPPPGHPVTKVTKRANRKILEINRKLKAVGSLISSETQERPEPPRSPSPPLNAYDDDDIILVDPNSQHRSQPADTTQRHSPVASREIPLKFRSRADFHKIPVLSTAPLSEAVRQLSVKLKVPPSRILLLRKDMELPVHSTANELGLGIADIIDCVIIAVDEPEKSSDMLTVRLQGKDKGSTREYSLNKDTPLGSILSQYLSSLPVETRRKVRFQFDGSKVTHSQTPSQLDMEDGDVIEQIFPNTGPRRVRNWRRTVNPTQRYSALPAAAMPLADPTSDTTPFFSDESEAESSEEPRGEASQNQDDEEPASGVSVVRAASTVAVLCFINLLNYMDRFTVAGVLPDIEQYFGIDDGNSGLLQTVFICSYMFLAPVFGYLGDRYNRKLIMSVGISFWSLVTLASSFTPKNCFWLLLFTRGLVGVGEASYSTIAPTIIADLYVKGQRTRALSIFYFAIPVGSGLGYIVGSKVDDVAGDWHWALRVTPALGVVAVVMLLFIVKEPTRGAIEARPEHTLPRTTWLADMKSLGRNPSFMLSTFGFTSVAFVTGSLALWAPAFLFRASVFTGERPPCVDGPCDTSDSLYFGIITVVSGILGVASGAEVSRRLRVFTPRADPLVCAMGLLLSAPFLYLAIVFAQVSTVATYVFIFLGETFLSMNWAIVADILLYVVVPTRRSTAEAFQIVVSHLLGDAGSPYMLGKISDSLRKNDSYLWQFRSLQLSLLTCSFVAVVGGGFFLATALFIERDRQHAANYTPSDDEPIVVPKSGRSTRVPVSSVLI
ncbi:hypothetical protein UPYG_G00111090 [Umbra pygmaea]|uniref:Protein spinster homolog 1 n=1 Tax=Umbra pygmaea TaxID=75934 RepID=A0ABD0XKH4_UMBPY